MENKNIWGLIILIILLLSLVAALYNIIIPDRTSAKEQLITNNYTLTDAQMTGINRVNINFTGNMTGMGVRFLNKSDTLYDLSIKRDEGSAEPNVTYSRNGDVLNVNISMDSGSVDLALGNRCTYNGTLQSKIGGFGILLGNQSKIENLNTSIKYIGGGMLRLEDTSFKKIDLNANLGGFLIQSQNSGINSSGNITSNVQIGGITIQIEPTEKIGVKFKGAVDLGGISFAPGAFNIIQNSTTIAELESKDFNNKTVKIQIESNVGLGGINLNMFFMPLPMPQEA